eukprot:TRINITY_DN21907_c0_g1_i2.p1 TRINITY_DN21907_c0_g1~~TRINITY_DN21907_c0_g1_i2.p1  ORF type:complete len:152 (+),score=14.08 TRINITY_DN21907_c0_g1_i2:106-561(+)
MRRIECRHEVCYHGQYHRRAEFSATNYSKRSAHEKVKEEHPCSNTCQRCHLLKNMMVQRPLRGTKKEKEFRCRHLNCRRLYCYASDRITHEVKDRHDERECGDSCPRCLDLKGDNLSRASRSPKKSNELDATPMVPPIEAQTHVKGESVST